MCGFIRHCRFQVRNVLRAERRKLGNIGSGGKDFFSTARHYPSGGFPSVALLNTSPADPPFALSRHGQLDIFARRNRLELFVCLSVIVDHALSEF
jgi:hypothetical protein